MVPAGERRERDRTQPAATLRGPRAQIGNEVEAAGAGHLEVADHDVRRRGIDGAQRLLGAAGDDDVGAAPLEELGDHVPGVGRIVHHEQAHAFDRRARTVRRRPGQGRGRRRRLCR